MVFVDFTELYLYLMTACLVSWTVLGHHLTSLISQRKAWAQPCEGCGGLDGLLFPRIQVQLEKPAWQLTIITPVPEDSTPGLCLPSMPVM